MYLYQMISPWHAYIDDYLSDSLSVEEIHAFEDAMEDNPDLEREVALQSVEKRAMDRFYNYTWDKPDDFPQSFPATKLYFASLFTSALFLGTFSARATDHPLSGPEQHSDEDELPPGGTGGDLKRP